MIPSTKEMDFEIKGKVALITGSASGIGLQYAKELLRNGLRALTIADVNVESGEKAKKEIEEEFGTNNKVIFVQTDISNFSEFEVAFKETVEQFNNVDILINNAGILNDANWEKQISINMNGTIHGILLGLDKYIPTYKSGQEGVIVNISSIVGIDPMAWIPIYSGTKSAIICMTRAWGSKEHYERTKVKVIALCPGGTDTPILAPLTVAVNNLGPAYKKILRTHVYEEKIQKPEECAKAMVTIIKKGNSGSIWVAEGGKEPYEVLLADHKTKKHL